MSFDLVIRGGTVVTPDRAGPADIGISSGRIEAVERPEVIPDDGAARVIDASGLLVLPGAVDVHTHTRIPSVEEPHRFLRDSVAAAFGGTTTFLAFNNPGTGISEFAQRTLRGGIDEWLARTQGESGIDYGLSAVITAQQDDPMADLHLAIERGVPTLKAFMVYDFGIEPARLRPMLSRVAEAGGLLELHCEDRDLLEREIGGLLTAGRSRPADHAVSRPPGVEAKGTAQAVGWALEDGAPLYVVHLSCTPALEAAAEARRHGARVYVETCPHFLVLDESVYEGEDESAIRYVVSPPIRPASDREALWNGVSDGLIDVIATDHVPDRLGVEKQALGQPFTAISNGAPGIETLMSLVYSEGVAKGRITLERMVEVLSAAPARLFGLRNKGTIDPGKDADLVLFDSLAVRTISQESLRHTSDYTPYEGMTVQGAIERVLVRGEDVVRDGRFVGQRGFGKYQERSLAG